ncbi:MAG: serine hydrolase [Saprospiraceae bacterium]|nr:serine hydrolase [Saprospiraceae bacterium]
MSFKLLIWPTGLALLLTALSCQRAKRDASVAVPPFSGADTAQVDMLVAGMSMEQKIGQLIVWDAPIQDSTTRAEVFEKTNAGLIGGLLLRNMVLSDFMYATDSLKRSAHLPLFLATDQKVALHNQFTGLQKFPLPSAIAAFDSSALHAELEQIYVKQCKALGINLTLNPSFGKSSDASQFFDNQLFEQNDSALELRFHRLFEELNDNRILAVGYAFEEFKFVPNDSIRRLELAVSRAKINAGLPGLLVSELALRTDTLKQLPADYTKYYLGRYLKFKGLMTVEVQAEESPESKLLAGADLLITPDAAQIFKSVHKLLDAGKLTELDINQRVRRVLLAKAWVSGGKLPIKFSIVPHDSVTHKPVRFVSIGQKKDVPSMVPIVRPRPANLDVKVDKTVCYFEDPRWDYYIERLFENSVVLARDEHEIVPLKELYEVDFQVFKYSKNSFKDFDALFSKYANFKSLEQKISASGELKPLTFEATKRQPVAIVLLDSVDLQPGFHKQFIESLNATSAQTEVILVNFGNPKNLHYFEKSVACVQVFERNKFTEAFTAQLLFGGVTAEGRLPGRVDETLDYGTSISRKPVRLGFASAEETGIASERLVGINAIAETAIDHGVFPGCQVAVAKDGQVIFSKSFGNFTYSKTAQPVSNTDLYDIASVTKVAATTLAVMKLVENGQLNLDGRVADYVEVPTGSAVGNIKIRELLLHQSGLQAQMPLSKFFSGKNVPAKGCNDYFCRKRKGSYNVKVADGLYFRNSFQDTVAKRVFNLAVNPNPRFRYSDVNFYLLKRVVETIANTTIDRYVFENIYKPLGLRNITYNPLYHLPKNRLVPTEQDNYWRKTLVQGYVHDPSVALMGGVGGSAGLFCNAEDLAVLFHMLLEGGNYGGRQLFEKKTVDDFVENRYTNNHRGLGFDKPTKRRYPTYSPHASPKSFGHTGFTGTCVWVDPEQSLVYVFLSNRVNPSSRNGKIFTEGSRSRIHEVVYSAFGSFENSLPELEVEEEMIEVEEGAGG